MVATPRKWPGRNLPSNGSPTPPTSTHVACPGRYTSVVCGREDEIGAALGQFRQVRVERARILRQVFRRPELAGIDVDRRHDDVALGLGRADEAEVPFVQGAHGGNQADLAPGPSQRRQGSAQFGDRGKQSGSGVQVHFLQRSRCCCSVQPVRGCTIEAAIAAAGSRTNRRWVMRGCGSTSDGVCRTSWS